MTKRVVDYDPFTRITTTFDYTPDGMVILGHEHADVAPLLDFNKALQNDDDYTKRGIKDSWWHCASIPPIIIEKWKNELGVDVFNKHHMKAVKKLLNQPEYRYLKTTTKMI